MSLILQELRDLFLGKPDFLPKNSKYWEIMEKIDEKEKKLSEAEMKRFESIFNDVNASNTAEVENAFNQGFCAGAQLMAEVFANKI